MLEKLTIEGFQDDTLHQSAGSVTLQINPERISHGFAVDIQHEEALLTYKKVPRYVTRLPETLSFEFYLDGTGVLPLGGSVSDKLTALRGVVYDYDGTIHRTRYLKVMWGNLDFACSLKTMKVDYELFNPSGNVLRAKLTMEFLEHITNAEAAQRSRNSSPDLSHQVTVRPGDTLPLLCHRVYGDSRHYPLVARANGLDGLTLLEPGAVLTFPPVET